MKSRIFLLILNLILCTSIAIAQDHPPRPNDTKTPPSREGNREPRRSGGQENVRQQYSIEQAIFLPLSTSINSFISFQFPCAAFGIITIAED